jgi:hypothetical protein
MKKLLLTGVALAIAGLLGCAAPRYADVPAPTRFANTKQQKLQAAEHWQTIAEHFAKQLADDLKGKLGDRAVYMPLPGGEQAFVEGFRELLITSLLAQGLPVSTEAKNALSVDVRYSIYRFRPERLQNTYFYGDATALAAGIWAVGGIAAAEISHASGVAAGAKLLAVAAAADGFGWLSNEVQGRGEYANGPVPRSEILLTASVADASRMVARRSNIYYTMDEDKALYWDRPSAAHVLSVSGDCDQGRKTCAR